MLRPNLAAASAGAVLGAEGEQFRAIARTSDGHADSLTLRSTRAS